MLNAEGEAVTFFFWTGPQHAGMAWQPSSSFSASGRVSLNHQIHHQMSEVDDHDSHRGFDTTDHQVTSEFHVSVAES